MQDASIEPVPGQGSWAEGVWEVTIIESKEEAIRLCGEEGYPTYWAFRGNIIFVRRFVLAGASS